MRKIIPRECSRTIVILFNGGGFSIVFRSSISSFLHSSNTKVMRVIVSLLAGLVGTAFASPAQTKTTSSVKTYSTKPAYPLCNSNAPFATVNGRLFDYNGTRAGPKYFAGTNTW